MFSLFFFVVVYVFGFAVGKFGKVCEKRKLQGKVMKFSLSEERESLKVRLVSDEQEEVGEFKYLGSFMSLDVGREEELKNNFGEVAKIIGGLWEKGKASGAAGGQAGTVDEDVSDSQSDVTTGTHWSRPARQVMPVSPKMESSENHLPGPVPLK